jgi:hypothetical protein
VFIGGPDGRVVVGRSIRLIVVVLATALTVAACGGEDEATPSAATPDASTPQVVDDGSLAAGEQISAPEGEVVLTVTGDIGTANKGKRPRWPPCARPSAGSSSTSRSCTTPGSRACSAP